jgi:hypothetical protein
MRHRHSRAVEFFRRFFFGVGVLHGLRCNFCVESVHMQIVLSSTPPQLDHWVRVENAENELGGFPPGGRMRRCHWKKE